MTWAKKLAHSFGGSYFESPQTLPLLISLMDKFLTLNPTLSPGIASIKAS